MNVEWVSWAHVGDLRADDLPYGKERRASFLWGLRHVSEVCASTFWPLKDVNSDSRSGLSGEVKSAEETGLLWLIAQRLAVLADLLHFSYVAGVPSLMEYCVGRH